MALETGGVMIGKKVKIEIADFPLFPRLAILDPDTTRTLPAKVAAATALVAGVMKRMAEGFAQAREQLEGQWSRGEDVGTEDLRVALQRYRSFFQRLLSA